MPQQYPVMTTHTHEDMRHRTIIIVVEHDPGQSFSRAVLPKARKAFRRWVAEHIVFGKLVEHGATLGYHDTPDGRTLSVVRFGY